MVEVRITALTGIRRVGWTIERRSLKGKPPSFAKALPWFVNEAVQIIRHGEDRCTLTKPNVRQKLEC